MVERRLNLSQPIHNDAMYLRNVPGDYFDVISQVNVSGVHCGNEAILGVKNTRPPNDEVNARLLQIRPRRGKLNRGDVKRLPGDEVFVDRLKVSQKTRRNHHVATRLHQTPVQFVDLTKCVSDLTVERLIADTPVVLGDHDQRPVEIDSEAAKQRLTHFKHEVARILGIDLLKRQRRLRPIQGVTTRYAHS